MRVLVTGGSGFLGSHIAEQLLEGGHQVRCLVRKSSDKSFLESLGKIEFAYGSVEDKDSVAAAFSDVDAVIHSAGLVKAKTPEDFVATNVDGTRHLLECAHDNKSKIQRFVLISSLAAHGPSEDGLPLSEDREPRPVTHYGRSKLGAERLAVGSKDDFPVTVIRPPAIYGPRDHEMLVLFKMVSQRVFPGISDPRQKLSVVFGPDAARAAVLAVTVPHESGRAYYVEDGNTYTQNEMADGLDRLFGRKSLRFSIPLPFVKLAAHGSALFGKLANKAVIFTPDKVNELAAPNWVCSADRIRAELGWLPSVNWEEGAKLTADWYRNAGWI